MNIAHVGTDAVVPLVRKAIAHRDETVRNWAIMGIGWAVGSGHASPWFLSAMFDALTPLAAGESDKGDIHAADYMIEIDRDRAAALMCTDRFLRFDSSEMTSVLRALQKHRIPVSRERLWAILEHARPMASKYPWESIYGACLLMLAETRDQRALGEIQSALDSNNRYVRMDAANALLRAHGLASLDDLTEALGNREAEGLTTPQRSVLLLKRIDGEVNNGGYSQYFFNASGDQWPVALEAARSLGATHVASQLERAIAVFGRKGPSIDNSRRRRQYGRLSDKTERTLDDLSSDYFKDHDQIHRLLARYVLAHHTDFAGLEGAANSSPRDRR